MFSGSYVQVHLKFSFVFFCLICSLAQGKIWCRCQALLFQSLSIQLQLSLKISLFFRAKDVLKKINNSNG